MKKNFAIFALIVAVIALTVTLVMEKKDATTVTTTEVTTTEESTTEPVTTEVTTEETTTEVTSVEDTTAEETTEALSEKETQIYENLELFKEIRVLASELPFVVSGVDAIESVKLYIPRQPIGDEDVWENTYIDIECTGKSEKVAIKFEPSRGICTGNLVPKNEMIHSNLTYVYIDGEYSQNYTFDKDGEMVIFMNFSEGVSEIKISNRSANPIFEGVIDGEDVVVNDIIVHFN